LAKGLDFLLAADLEKTSGMDSRFHAGAEARIMEILALRVGSGAGNLTAGAGLDWRGLGADYQFEDNPLGNIHRFGLAVRFGSTVAEARQAYLNSAEVELQARLESAFTERTQAQENQLVDEAQQELAHERWEEALNLIGTLKVLAPARLELPAMTAAAYSGLASQQEKQGDLAGAALSWRGALAAVPGEARAKAGLARVEAESDARSKRTRKIKAKYEAALDAFAQDDLTAAQAGFQEVLAISPRDQDAITMLARTEAAMTRRATAMSEEALSLAEAGLLKSARERWQAATLLDPGAPGLMAVATELDRLESQVQAPTVSATENAPAVAPVAEANLSPQRRREIDGLYRRGLNAMEARRRDEAVRYWEMVWSVDPDHEKVREYLGQEYLARGMEAYADGALRVAVASWEDALRVDPTDQRARGYLDRARQQLSRMEKISSNN
jgi:tetratricopeptide (TPR) repeat protein